jgi:ribosomal protein S13
VGDGLRREDKRTVQGQATQQPASTMRGQEGGVCVFRQLGSRW